MENHELEKFLDTWINREKQTVPNPFMATRILQRLETEFFDRPVRSGWLIRSGIQPVAIVVALVVGIFIGAYTARHSAGQESRMAVKARNMEDLRAGLFIPEHADDANTLNLTH